MEIYCRWRVRLHGYNNFLSENSPPTLLFILLTSCLHWRWECAVWAHTSAAGDHRQRLRFSRYPTSFIVQRRQRRPHRPRRQQPDKAIVVLIRLDQHSCTALRSAMLQLQWFSKWVVRMWSLVFLLCVHNKMMPSQELSAWPFKTSVNVSPSKSLSHTCFVIWAY